MSTLASIISNLILRFRIKIPLLEGGEKEAEACIRCRELIFVIITLDRRGGNCVDSVY